MNASIRIAARAALVAAAVSILAPFNAFAGGVTADLAITKNDGVGAANAGGQVVYTIVASNAGPGDATATVTDVLPLELTCSWTCVASAGSSCTAAGTGDINDVITLLAGGDATYTATCDVDPDATGTIENTATIAGDAGTSDPDPTNTSATDIDQVLPSFISVPTLGQWGLLALLALIAGFGLVQFRRTAA